MAEAPDCASFTPPSPTTVTVDASCTLDGADAPNLELGEVVRCSEDCSTPGLTLWIPVRNVGPADAGAFEVRVFRRLQRSLSEITVSQVTSLASGSETVVGPITVDPVAWGPLTAEVVIDTRNTVAECQEDGHVLDLGAFDGVLDDVDGDGYTALACGGLDCDDDDPGKFPGALDVLNDGIDQNCDGDDARSDICDWDQDGTEAPWCGGTDCNDADPEIAPGVSEIPDDGIDQDCDGEDACAEGFWVEGGLGCSTRGGASAGWLALGAMLLLGRRRRTPDGSKGGV
jgi:MYXO-CTERM domain-containing protein